MLEFGRVIRWGRRGDAAIVEAQFAGALADLVFQAWTGGVVRAMRN